MKTNVKQLVEGQEAVIVGVANAKKSKTKKEEPYVNLRITDGSGSIFINVWQESPFYKNLLELAEGQRIEAHIKCTKVARYINGELLSYKIVQSSPNDVVDREALKNELRSIIESIEDKQLSTLVREVIKREEIINHLFTAPATQMSGYSFEGGLLAHIVRVAQLSKTIGQVFNSWSFNQDVKATVHVDLLVCASILHDIGKILAFKANGNRVEKTMAGELFEDSYLTMKIINEEIEKATLSEEKRLLLEHIIGASKGKQGYGALHIPRTKEAILFHFIDAMDVQMANLEYLKRNSEGELFNQLFQKTLYLGDF